MHAHLENDWHGAILTATAFVAMFVTLLFGVLDASSCSQDYLVEFMVATGFGGIFVSSLSAEPARVSND